MSNLKVIVFGLFSISHSTVVPFSTLSTTSFGFLSVDFPTRRVFGARFEAAAAVDDATLDWLDGAAGSKLTGCEAAVDGAGTVTVDGAADGC